MDNIGFFYRRKVSVSAVVSNYRKPSRKNYRIFGKEKLCQSLKRRIMNGF